MPKSVLNLRPAVAGDEPWLTDTFIDCLRTPITEVRGGWDEARERSQFAAQFRSSDTRVMMNGRVPVGFWTAWEETDHTFLGTLCVISEYQNRGFGVLAMCALAKQSQRVPIRFSVLKTNVSARRFYERLGSQYLSSSRNHDHFEWPIHAIAAACARADS